MTYINRGRYDEYRRESKQQLTHTHNHSIVISRSRSIRFHVINLPATNTTECNRLYVGSFPENDYQSGISLFRWDDYVRQLNYYPIILSEELGKSRLSFLFGTIINLVGLHVNRIDHWTLFLVGFSSIYFLLEKKLMKHIFKLIIWNAQ